MNFLHWIARCRRHPSAILLFVQLAGMVLYPFVENTQVGRIGFGVFGIAVLIFTTAMVRITPAWTWVSVCNAVPAIVLQVLQAPARLVRGGREHR